MLFLFRKFQLEFNETYHDAISRESVIFRVLTRLYVEIGTTQEFFARDDIDVCVESYFDLGSPKEYMKKKSPLSPRSTKSRGNVDLDRALMPTRG